MNTFVTGAKRWLKSKHINAPNDWLEACIEWIKDENEGNLQSQQQVNELVFEQWLLSDLHELGTQCLPGELVQTSKYHLNGIFALQIDSMVDISQSCYGQLQKVKGTENANTEVSADTHKPWEPKPSRMLMLKLTDGTSNVQAMEYRQISCLDSKIHPGCKILIKGKILCRNGMLMLKQENVSVLGGEVDSLMEANTPENILKSTLETNVSNADKRYRQEFEGGPTTNNTKMEVKPVIHNNRSQILNRNHNPGNTGMQPKMKLEPASQNNIDEFEDDLPLDAFLDDMTEFTNIKSNTVNTNNNSRTNNTRVQGHSSSGGRNPYVNSSGNFTNNSSSSLSRNLSCNVLNNKQQTNINNSDKRQNLSSHKHNQINSNNLPTQNITAILEEDINEACFMDDDFDDFEISGLCQNSSSLGTSNKRNSICNSDISKKRQLVSPLDNQNTKRRSIQSSPDFEDEMEAMQGSTSPDHIQESSRRRPLFSTPGRSNIKVEEPPSKSRASDFDVSIDRSLGLDLPPNIEVKEIKTETSSQEVDLNYDPWTYLSVVRKYLPTQQLICFKVKAYISTLIGKLECPDGKSWCLPVKINDGTASMDVDLSNKVLTDLIGFSAPQSQVLRKMAKTDFRVKEKLTQGIKKCQQKLVELLCIMEIEISPRHAKPEVTSLVDITTADISVLADRLTKTVNKLL